jgi:rod shape-determining protein MreD
VVLGALALMLQGTVARFLPAALCPDLALVLVVTAGLALPAASGLVVAALLGAAADLLSSALLGQHALLYTVAFAVTQLANRQFELRRAGPLVIGVTALAAGLALGLAGLARLVGLPAPLELGSAVAVLIHAAATGILAVPVQRLAESVRLRVAESEGQRRPFRLATRRTAS